MQNKEFVKKAIQYARSNYNSTDITVQNVAEHAGFSIDYFNRLFLSHTGFTVMAYINHVRIKKAVELLRTTDRSILDIALDVGFDSHEGFIKSFRKIYGITPGEYRKANKDRILSWNELTDVSCVNRFLKDNPDFRQIDADVAIDYLLEKDSLRYGYFCTTIQCMGLEIVSPAGNPENGLIGVGDDRKGGIWLELIQDDFNALAEWINRFDCDITFYSDKSPEYVREKLASHGVAVDLKATPQSVYLGDPLPVSLPKTVQIRKLSPADKNSIIKWANGKSDGYIQHLLNEKHYLDPCVLEYGVFENNELIAIAGCRIDEAHGFRLNNCCHIRFANGKEHAALYRPIFSFVTNDVIEQDVLPFDDIQHGKFAETHGGFTANDMGFTTVSWQYNTTSI